MSRTVHSEPDSIVGFTLIEVLVALTILGVVLMSIGSLFAENMRSTRALERHLNLVSIAHAIEAGLPDSSRNEIGPLTGNIDGHSWRVDFRPFTSDSVPIHFSSRWVPQTVAITVSAPSGATFRLETVRLYRKSEQ